MLRSLVVLAGLAVGLPLADASLARAADMRLERSVGHAQVGKAPPSASELVFAWLVHAEMAPAETPEPRVTREISRWARYISLGQGAFRGPGHYLSLIKIAVCWAVFALWVWTCDWISRDCQVTRLNYAVWNAVVFFTFAVALLLLLSPFGIPFPISLTLLILAYACPALAYVYVRNGSVESHEQVLTPDHFRYLITGKEKLAAHERGAPVEFTLEGENNNANLVIARQSPGYVMVKDLIADLVNERGEAVTLDYSSEAVTVRYQVDGIWHNNEPRDRESGDAILDVLKTLSLLNTEERRKKQSGAFGAKLEKSKFNCLLTSQGTKAGERAILRLDHGRQPFHTFDELGMREKIRDQFQEVIGGEKGIVLFSALPAGGLTTTIDVSLEETDRLLRNFVAIEDEAHRELEIENIEVTTYNRAGGETPLKVLPTLVRTYPDVIVVRDLVDVETVKFLCQQVEQNRLIVGSIRAKNAADALLRIQALKVPADLFAPVLSALLYARLVRRLCPICKVAYEPTPDILKKLGIPQGRVQSLYREPNAEEIDKVCTDCGGIGYLGRIGIFELLVPNDKVRQILIKQPKHDLIKRAARAAGMRSIQEEGILLVAKGVTSLAELMRVLKQ